VVEIVVEVVVEGVSKRGSGGHLVIFMVRRGQIN